MDRLTNYFGQVPLETDLLHTNQNAMVGLAKLAGGVLGTTTVVNGFTCTPTGPASLNVIVTAGEVYQLENLEATTWSSLSTDTHSIVKQGILLDPLTFGITPPGTVGFSQAFLVEVQYADLDTGSVTLPYFNTTPPTVVGGILIPPLPFSGPGNLGTAQNTVRKGIAAVQIKAGAAATTGTQTTPAADAGWTGIYVVTVANGAATITSGNIVQFAAAPFFPTLPSIPLSVQDSQWTAFADTGTADALSIAPLPAPAAWVTGLLFIVKKSGSANATTSPTLNILGSAGTLLGAKSIVDRRGNAIVAGDLPASAELMLFYDGTNVRNLGVVAADVTTALAANGSLRNIKQFSTSTRVSMAGTSGNSWTVSPWSPGSYTKTSATSTLLVWATFPTFVPGSTGPPQTNLTVGGTTFVFSAANNNPSLSIGEGALVQAMTGLSSGSLALSVSFQRNDSTNWAAIFCFTSTDAVSFPTSTTATIIIAEVGV